MPFPTGSFRACASGYRAADNGIHQLSLMISPVRSQNYVRAHDARTRVLLWKYAPLHNDPQGAERARGLPYRERADELTKAIFDTAFCRTRTCTHK